MLGTHRHHHLVEAYRSENGEYPPNLDSVASPYLCPNYEVNAAARTLYSLQGLTVEPYRYEVSEDSFVLSCHTCHQRWHRQPGFPRYSSADGLDNKGALH